MKENYSIDSIILPELKIYQPKKGFRFTTDSLLLAGFVKDTNYDVALEIGAGSGIISVILATFLRIKKIYAVEIQKSYYDLLCETIKINNLQDRIIPINADIKEFKPVEQMDMIISNPPYRKGDTGYRSNLESKNVARFTDTLSIEDIFRFSKSYLKTGGFLYLSFIADRLNELFIYTKHYLLEPKRIRFLFPDIDKAARLVLVEYRNGAGTEMIVEPPLFHKIKGEDTIEFLNHTDPEWWKAKKGYRWHISSQ